MNEQKIDCQERIIQQSHGLISDFNFELGSQSSQIFDLQQQAWNMGVCVQQPTEDQPNMSQLQNHGLPRSPSSIMSRFESPASAFYATERCMGFSQYHSQVGNSQFPSGQTYNESYSSMDSSEQADPNLDIRNTLQSVVKSQPSSYHQYQKSSEKPNQIPLPSNNLFEHQQNKLHGESTASVRRPSLSLPPKENQDQAGCCNSFSTSPVTQLSFFSQQGKQSPRISSGNVSTTYGESPSTSPVLSSKTRIRWNQDLHEKFVECVNRLGGADKATPKAILKMMCLDGLTIFHVKSHLQKYRIAKYLPDTAEGKYEKRTTLNVEPQLDMKTLLQPNNVNFSDSGLQIKEALQLQLDVQRRLHEQLEIQRNLQLRIEEQGKQLKKMFDLQQKTSNDLFKTQNLDITCHEDAPSDSLNAIQVSSPEDSGNTNFPSKIS
ncbi:myb family transcription factor PHL5 isoform X1 [Prunus avium]|uniref:Myb family transcription factor PHL5 isoform X1 n=1 Tax=Prunus avium TaxID=42229 RepID=A0A6P5TV28_PRUAV|nr:myb family transcription factor PHL5 isoform X1 [Prunus avium]